MKYIIMAGGVYSAWETPRQLTQIRGEPLVGRTIRLLKEAGVDDIAISTHDERFNGFRVPLLHHDNNFHGYEGRTGTWVEAFYPTEEPTCYLMGDVFFSSEAIRKIVRKALPFLRPLHRLTGDTSSHMRSRSDLRSLTRRHSAPPSTRSKHWRSPERSSADR